MFLMIRNPGVADYKALTLIGASESRDCGRPGTIGCFGSGFKYGMALLLRRGIQPVVCTGSLKMDISDRPEKIGDRWLNRLKVKFSGKDENNRSKTNTEDLGFLREMGERDWTKLEMATREIVSNAIDGCLKQGLDCHKVEIQVMDKPRCKAGHTAVFIPYTPEIEFCHRNIDGTFLHFRHNDLLNRKLLPKSPEDHKLVVYTNGVVASRIQVKSVFDYNLGDELQLDESRNASDWDIRHAISLALRDASASELSTVIREVIKDPNIWESNLTWAYLGTNQYDSANPEAKERRKKNWQTAWRTVAGDKAVLSGGNPSVMSFVVNKGLVPVHIESTCWAKALESYGIPCEKSVLDNSELEGRAVGVPSTDMLSSLDKVWNLLETFSLTNGKEKPNCRSFDSIMQGGGQRFGCYENGTVFVHKTLSAGPQLDQTVLEEVVHHVTGSTDGSRDIQDYLLRGWTAMAF
jgi:hypothetical protein